MTAYLILISFKVSIQLENLTGISSPDVVPGSELETQSPVPTALIQNKAAIIGAGNQPVGLSSTGLETVGKNLDSVEVNEDDIDLDPAVKGRNHFLSFMTGNESEFVSLIGLRKFLRKAWVLCNGERMRMDRAYCLLFVVL